MALSSRAGNATIPPGGGRWYEVVAGEGACAEPRIVLISSNGPLRIRIDWSAGRGDQTVELGIGRGLKVCVWARSVRVYAQHHSGNGDVFVQTTIADGFEPTRNVITAEVEVGTTVFAIPEWSQAVRLELADEAELVNSTLAVVDGDGNTRGRVLASAQPERGLALSGIGSVEVVATAAGRLIFDLVF